eukprot:TRINITY_DN15463_c0_g1_i2.p1 TRINITY_DN15463_c0_g1~~TRINITY_DN15463_c0_g1_i2.p1  ORF type:complete len:106 (-),score=14.59 TRINITY_DN15463_c0_g1_i2:8-325(-)
MNLGAKALCRPPPDWSALPSLSARQWGLLCLGIFFVTFLCPAMTQFAIFEIPVAIYMTLTSTGPVWTLPIGYAVKGEPISRRALLGSSLAVLGVVPMALSHAQGG